MAKCWRPTTAKKAGNSLSSWMKPRRTSSPNGPELVAKAVQEWIRFCTHKRIPEAGIT